MLWRQLIHPPITLFRLPITGLHPLLVHSASCRYTFSETNSNMAIAKKGMHFTGTLGRINYYEIDGRTYARIKSSLTRGRVLKEKEFEKTRKYAADLGTASRIGSFIYKALPADIKGRWIFRAITGEAASLIYTGKEEQEVKDLLWEKYIENTGCTNNEAGNNNQGNTKFSSKKSNKQFHSIFIYLWEKQGKPSRYFKRAWKHRKRFNPDTIPRRSEYFLGMERSARWD